MSLTVYRSLPAFLLLLVLSAPALPIYAGEQAKSEKPHASTPSTRERLGLYGPRVRRSTMTYLRLRLLELREEGLDRARAAIERRLSVDDLIAGCAQDGRARNSVHPAICPASTP